MATTCDCACQRCASEYPYTSLEVFRKEICGLNIWSFWGWESSLLRQTKLKKPCDLWVGNHSADPSRVGREEIRKALARAEQTLLQELGYPVVPTWSTKEILNYLWPQGSKCLVMLPLKPILTIGIENYYTLCTPSRDPDEVGADDYILNIAPGDTIPYRFTVTCTIPYGVKPSEIQLFFAPSERTEKTNDAGRWRIPVKDVQINGTTATITGEPALLAKPALQDQTVPLQQPNSEMGGDFALNPAYLPNYAAELEVRFVFVTPCGGIKAHTSDACGCSACGGSGSCGHCQNVSYCIESAEYGLVRPTWNRRGCSRLPDKFCFSYLAQDCSRDWTREIAMLTAARLACPLCACGQDGLSYWQHDFAADKDRAKTFKQLENQLGTRRGEMEVWNAMRGRKRIAGLTI